MKILPLLAASAFFLAPRAFAGLGDTPEQADAAYGKPTSVAHTPDNLIEAHAYKVRGMDVLVFFYKGRAGQVSYQVPVSVTFGDKDIEAMLDENRGKFEWASSGTRTGADGGTVRGWDRSDGAFASAFSLHGKNSFVVETRLYQRAYQPNASFIAGPAEKPAAAASGR